MISERAKHSLDLWVKDGLQAALSRPDDTVHSLDTVLALNDLRATHVVMLSVASYRFRLMLLIYFSHDEATRSHFARSKQIAASELTAQALEDAICEASNMCCGAFNRALGQVFPHLGMSTPNIVDRRCANHLHLMGFGHLQHFRLQLGSGMQFHASLCVSEYDTLDFEAQHLAPAPATGELEFF
jgi:hypothetical protein